MGKTVEIALESGLNSGMYVMNMYVGSQQEEMRMHFVHVSRIL